MDWFDAILNTGNVALGTLGNIGVAQAQAQGAAQQAAAAQAAQQQAFNNNLLMRQTTGLGGALNTNMVLVIMVGVAALFIINQANK